MKDIHFHFTSKCFHYSLLLKLVGMVCVYLLGIARGSFHKYS